MLYPLSPCYTQPQRCLHELPLPASSSGPRPSTPQAAIRSTRSATAPASPSTTGLAYPKSRPTTVTPAATSPTSSASAARATSSTASARRCFLKPLLRLPNCETVERNQRIFIQAIRDIAAGEELVYEYNLYDSDDDNADCYCGAPKCRGTMFSDEEVARRARIAKRCRNRQPNDRDDFTASQKLSFWKHRSSGALRSSKNSRATFCPRSLSAWPAPA